MQTKFTGKYFLSKPVKSGSTKVLVICLALSGRKLKKITLSPSLIIPFLSTTVGITNSSVTSFAYEFLTAVTASVSCMPSPSTIAL